MYKYFISTLFVSLSVALLIGLFDLASPSIAAAQGGDPAPLPKHCIGLGSLQSSPAVLSDPDFCGCTWGSIHYQGQTVVGAPVTIAYSQRITGTLTSVIAEVDGVTPFYSLSGAPLGARRGDIMTVTVDFAGQTVSRAFRAEPNGAQEQEVSLVIPQLGAWAETSASGFAQALAADGDLLWAAGTDGLRRKGPNSVEEIFPLPWPDKAISDLAIDAAGDPWVITADSVAQLSNGVWQTYTVPISGTLNTVTVSPDASPDAGTIYVGGAGDGGDGGAVALFDGGWELLHTVAKPVTTVTFDAAGHLWVGTWGDGVHRQDDSGTWIRFRAEDGLGSNRVWSSAAGAKSAGVASAGTDGVWFGTDVALSADGVGGVSFFSLGEESWQTYTSADGLPAVDDFPLASSPALDLATDSDGRPWVATAQGLYLLATEKTWAAHATPTEGTSQLAIAGERIYAASAEDIYLLDRGGQPGSPPIAAITSQGPLSISQMALLEITGTGQDSDTLGTTDAATQILGWAWSSDRDGPLCTTAETCRISAQKLTVGEHQISLRVQDNEGAWSAADTISVTVTPRRSTYIPLFQ